MKNYFKITASVIVALLIFGALSIGIVSAGQTEQDREKLFLCHIGGNDIGPNDTVPATEYPYDYFYHELYYYYSDKDVASSDEATPDYILARATKGRSTNCTAYLRYSDRIICRMNGDLPSEVGYVIYVPREDKFYTLEQAVYDQKYGIGAVFEDYKLGHLVGDIDFDDVLSVKDATIIQKWIAGLETEHSIVEKYNVPIDYSDINLYLLSNFNNDDKVDIKDATAIQKRIAGLL